jgi:hypothetical protein
MARSINVNDLTLAHKGTSGTGMATIPDVCKTPSPGGPVPIPYPNIARASDLAKGTKDVKVDGEMVANKGSELSRSSGDEAGTAGGVKSSTFAKEATWILYSFDVLLEGKNACRLTDKLFMNHGNTACLAGWLEKYHAQNKRASEADACKALREYIDDMIGEGRKGDRGPHFPGRGLDERMKQNMGIGLKKGNPGFPPGTPEWKTHDEEIEKLQNDLKEKLEEFEEDCDNYNFKGKGKFTQNAQEWSERPRPTDADWKGPR